MQSSKVQIEPFPIKDTTLVDSTITSEPVMGSLDKTEQSLDLITRRVEVLDGKDLIKAALTEGKNQKCFWGQFSITIPYP